MTGTTRNDSLTGSRDDRQVPTLFVVGGVLADRCGIRTPVIAGCLVRVVGYLALLVPTSLPTAILGAYYGLLASAGGVTVLLGSLGVAALFELARTPNPRAWIPWAIPTLQPLASALALLKLPDRMRRPPGGSLAIRCADGSKSGEAQPVPFEQALVSDRVSSSSSTTSLGSSADAYTRRQRTAPAQEEAAPTNSRGELEQVLI